MPQAPFPTAMPVTSSQLAPGTIPLTVALILAVIMQLLDATIVNVALPHMKGSMSAGQDQITWVLTSYVVMAGISTPLSGFLVSRFGRKRVFVLSLVFFTASSMLCGVAQSLEQIVLFRMMQGASGAFMVPLSQTIIMDIYPKERQAGALAAWSASSLIAPIMGPTIGGYVTEYYSWRWAFFINLPIGIISILGVVLFLSESKRDANLRFDLAGFGLLGMAIGALQMMLDRGTTLDWFSSKEIVIESVLAALAFYLFIAHMFTAQRPFLDRTIFKDTNFIIGMITAFIVMLVMNGNVALMPTMLQSLMGYPAMTTGLLILPRGIGALIPTLFVGRLRQTFDTRLLIIFGLLLTATSLWQMSGFSLDASQPDFILTGLLQGFGTGLVFAPLVQASFSNLAPRLRTEGAWIFSLVRNLGIAIGVSADSTLLARNTQINHAELVTNITPFSQALQALPQASTMESVQGAAALDSEIGRQAGMIAYIDLYRFSAYLIIGVALIIPFLRMRHRNAAEKPMAVEM